MTFARNLLRILLTSTLALAALDCRPEGPVLPRPTSLPSSSIFQEAASRLHDSLDAAVSGSINAGWPVENSSFSLAVIGWDQDDAAVPVWEYHHLSKANKRGTKKLDRDSQYLIGSITKVATVYLLIKSGIDLDAPITKFLPSLSNPDSIISWENVTLRMLASYLGGVPANYGFSEHYYLKDVFVKFGLPPIEDSDYPTCGITGVNKECSDQKFLRGMTESYPITAPSKRPVYSNSAFTLAGMALEKYTGKTYKQLVAELLSEPLDLQNTLTSPGDDEKAVIPPVENSWGSDYGQSAPAGGLVSSISDLTKFSHALLSRDLDLSPAQINEWLKPVSHPHPITVYGKSGGALGYRSQLSIVDDYGIAILILTAGPLTAASVLTEAMLTTFVPALDEISRHQAKQYEREFTSREDAPVHVEVSLAQDDDSLLISSFRYNGSDIASAIHQIWTLALGEFIPKLGKSIRAFPSDLVDNITMNGKSFTREVWHLWPEFIIETGTDPPNGGFGKRTCTHWINEDWVRYGGEPLDRVLLHKNEKGEVVGLEVPFLRSGVLTAKHPNVSDL